MYKIMVWKSMALSHSIDQINSVICNTQIQMVLWSMGVKRDMILEIETI